MFHKKYPNDRILSLIILKKGQTFEREKFLYLKKRFGSDQFAFQSLTFFIIIKDLNDIVKTNPVARIIVEWCIDDNGINVLYKNNGTDRYPDFKLYKMIARCVHKHTPQAQLDRNEFKDYIVQKDEIPNSEHIMNIDEM